MFPVGGVDGEALRLKDSFISSPYATWKVTMSSSAETPAREKKRLTPAQFTRVERNKERAILLRKARLAKKPYHNRTSVQQPAVDSGAGFLIDPDEELEENSLRLVETAGLPEKYIALILICDVTDADLLLWKR